MQEVKSKLIVYGYKATDDSILTEETKEENELSILIQQQQLPDFFSSMVLDFKCVVAQIACGNSHGLILASEGIVFSFGSNQFGQRGLRVNMRRERESNNGFNPTLVDFKEKIVSISAGLYHSAAVSGTGNVYTWGRGIEGQLGQKLTDCVEEPMRIESLQNIASVVCGGSHTLFLNRRGGVYAAGDNQWGQLGVEKRHSSVMTPTALQCFQSIPILQLAAGCEHSVFLSQDQQSIYVCGNNLFGQCGIEGVQSIEKPTKLPIKEKIAKIYSSLGTFSGLRTTSGIIYVWGTGSWGHARKPTNLLTNCQFQGSQSDRFKDIIMGDNYALTINEKDQAHLLGTHKLPDIRNPGQMECRLLNIESSDRMGASNRFILVAKAEDGSKVSVKEYLDYRFGEPLLDAINKQTNRSGRTQQESQRDQAHRDQQTEREYQLRDKQQRDLQVKEQQQREQQLKDQQRDSQQQQQREQHQREQQMLKDQQLRDQQQREQQQHKEQQQQREQLLRDQQNQREQQQLQREQAQREQLQREQQQQRDLQLREQQSREQQQREQQLQKEIQRDQLQREQTNRDHQRDREQRDQEHRDLLNQRDQHYHQRTADTKDIPQRDTSERDLGLNLNLHYFQAQPNRDLGTNNHNRDQLVTREHQPSRDIAREPSRDLLPKDYSAYAPQRETTTRETASPLKSCQRCQELQEKLNMLQARLSNQEEMMTNHHREKLGLIEQNKIQAELIEEQKRQLDNMQHRTPTALTPNNHQPRTPEKPIDMAPREYSFTGQKNARRTEAPLTLQHSYSQHSLKPPNNKENEVNPPIRMQGSSSYQKLSQVIGDMRNEQRPYEIRSITPLETRNLEMRNERLYTQEPKPSTPSESQQQYLSQRDSEDSQPVENSLRQNLNKSRGLIQSIDTILTQFKSMNQPVHHEKSKSTVTDQQGNPNTLIKSYFQRIEQLQQNIARSKQELRKSLEASKFCNEPQDDQHQRDNNQIDVVPVVNRHLSNAPAPRKQPYKPNSTDKRNLFDNQQFQNSRVRDKKSQMIRLEYRRNEVCEDQSKLRTLY